MGMHAWQRTRLYPLQSIVLIRASPPANATIAAVEKNLAIAKNVQEMKRADRVNMQWKNSVSSFILNLVMSCVSCR